MSGLITKIWGFFHPTPTEEHQTDRGSLSTSNDSPSGLEAVICEDYTTELQQNQWTREEIMHYTESQRQEIKVINGKMDSILQELQCQRQESNGKMDSILQEIQRTNMECGHLFKRVEDCLTASHESMTWQQKKDVELKTCKQSIQSEKEENKSLKRELQQKEEELTSLRKEAETREKLHQRLQNKLECARKTIQEQDEELKIKEQSLKEKMEENGRVNKDLQLLQDDKHRITASYDESLKQKESFKQSHQVLQNRITALHEESTKKLQQKELELESFKQSLRGLEEEKDRITALHEESTKKLKQKEIELESCKKSLQSLKDDKDRINKESTMKLQQKESELESLNQSLRGLQEEKHRITALHEESTKKLHQKEQELKRSVRGLQNHTGALHEESTTKLRDSRTEEKQRARERADLSKVTTVKQFEQQHYGKHDEVNLEYKELWIVPTIILLDLERHYKEEFNAKAVLTEIFVESYRCSKQHLTGLILDKLEELYTVHDLKNDPEKKGELENVSRAYGMLLQSSRAREDEVQRKAVAQICEKVMGTIKNSHPECADLQLEDVVVVAWKCVTQSCPIIACQPDKYDKKLHDMTDNKDWNKDNKDTLQLFYAKPVMYRSYHGFVLNRGLVRYRQT